MKTTRLCIATLLGICLTTVGYAQETVLASTEPSAVTETTGTDPAEEDEDKQEEPTFSFSGSVDTYFHSSFGTTNTAYGDISAPAIFRRQSWVHS
jgi:hypothetical protein